MGRYGGSDWSFLANPELHKRNDWSQVLQGLQLGLQYTQMKQNRSHQKEMEKIARQDADTAAKEAQAKQIKAMAERQKLIQQQEKEKLLGKAWEDIQAGETSQVKRLRQMAGTVAGVDPDSAKIYMDMAKTAKDIATEKDEITQLGKLQSLRREIKDKVQKDPQNKMLMKELKEVEQGIRKNVTIVGKTEYDISSSRRDELTADYDNLTNAVNDLDTMVSTLESDPSYAGLVGTARRMIQTGVGISQDLSTIFGESGAREANIIANKTKDWVEKEVARKSSSQEVYDEFFSPEIAGIPLFENSMAYAVARSRKTSGRLNVDDIKTAKKDVSVTGFASAKDVIARLKKLRGQVFRSRTQIKERAGIKGKQKYIFNKETGNLELQ